MTNKSTGAARGYLVAGACLLCPIWLPALVRVGMCVGGAQAISPEAAGVATGGGVFLGILGGAAYAIFRFTP